MTIERIKSVIRELFIRKYRYKTIITILILICASLFIIDFIRINFTGKYVTVRGTLEYSRGTIGDKRGQYIVTDSGKKYWLKEGSGKCRIKLSTFEKGDKISATGWVRKAGLMKVTSTSDESYIMPEDLTFSSPNFIMKVKDINIDIDNFLRVLKNEDRDIRTKATERLSTIVVEASEIAKRPPKSNFDSLEEHLFREEGIKPDDLDSVRVMSLGVLREMKKPFAIESLIAALKDEDRYKSLQGWSGEFSTNIQSHVQETLKIITEQDFGWDVSKWQEWWEKNKEKFSNKG